MLQARPFSPPARQRINNNAGFLKNSPGSLSTNAKTLKRTSILSVKNKSMWPEFVGMPGHEARRRIREEIPSVQAPIIPRNALITEEYVPGRVQIFVDENHTVIWPPQIG